ncbi:MAG: hypothetical protein ACREQJ_16545 [Candidatus Binatia bacterium]
MAEKHEFGSRGWFDALHLAIAKIVREGGPEVESVRWNVCEVFTDVPAHLAQGPGDRAAWHCRIRGREIAFGLGEIDDADLKIIADYATALPLARVRLADPGAQERVNETLMNAIGAGKMQILGDFGARPPAFAGLHDEMVAVTA